jgi:hypothetical protein
MPIYFRSNLFVKKLRTARPGNLGEIFSRGKSFYLLNSVLSGTEVHQHPLQWVPEGPVIEGKATMA